MNVNYLTTLNTPNAASFKTNDILPAHFYNNFVGLDKIFDQLNGLSTLPKAANYPPYNIKKTGDYNYVIEMALAGFERSDLEITVDGNKLLVVGKKFEDEEEETLYIHKGIANREFTREFVVADTVEVKEAKMENGVLSIILENIIPESKKKKVLEIL